LGRFKWAVRHPAGDGRFDWMLAAAPELQRLRDRGEGLLKDFTGLLQDVFFALLLPRPQVMAFADITIAARLNKFIVEQLLKSKDFRQARKFTVDNPVGCAMATIYYAGLLLHEQDREIFGLLDEIHALQQAYHSACNQGETAGIIAANIKGNPVLQTLFARKKYYWEAVAERRERELNRMAARLNVVLHSRARKALGIPGGDNRPGKRRGRAETGAEGWGDRQGQWTRGSIEEHMKQVEHFLLSPKLQRLAERIGRLKEVRSASRRPDCLESQEEVAGIIFGNDLALVVPDEWHDYFHPARNIYFKKKYADETLCLYDMAGKKEKGRGSMIICLDNSGSMQGPKEEASKAIAIAMLEIAVQRKRDFVVIMFGGPDDELKVFEVPGGRCGFEQLVEIGEYFLCSSGTDFERPLQEALRFLSKDKYPGGDIIFITDGVCAVSPEFLARYREVKKAREVRTVSVLVNYGQTPTAAVEAFSDELLFSKDLKGHDVAGDLFAILENS